MSSFPLSFIGNSNLAGRVNGYTADEILAELSRVTTQATIDTQRRADASYRGHVSTPEFWSIREQILRDAL